jgi:hypothetical protein
VVHQCLIISTEYESPPHCVTFSKKMAGTGAVYFSRLCHNHAMEISPGMDFFRGFIFIRHIIVSRVKGKPCEVQTL